MERTILVWIFLSLVVIVVVAWGITAKCHETIPSLSERKKQIAFDKMTLLANAINTAEEGDQKKTLEIVKDAIRQVNEEEKEKKKQQRHDACAKTLRWIGVIPAAILMCVICYAVAILNGGVVKWMDGESSISITDIIIFACSEYFSGYAFVLGGTYTAPNRRKIVSVTLTCIFASLVLLSLIVENMNGFSYKDTIANILSLAGAITACVRFNRGTDN